MTDKASRTKNAKNEARLELARKLIDDNQQIPDHKITVGTILREGWELDNKVWLIQTPTDKFMATTSHGGLYLMNIDELVEEIETQKEALDSLSNIKMLMEQ